MPILGATEENRPLLEESYRRILAAFEPHVGMTNYLEIKVWGLPCALAPFKYQVKRLQQLRSKFAALGDLDRDAPQPILTRTGCREPLAGG